MLFDVKCCNNLVQQSADVHASDTPMVWAISHPGCVPPTVHLLTCSLCSTDHRMYHLQSVCYTLQDVPYYPWTITMMAAESLTATLTVRCCCSCYALRAVHRPSAKLFSLSCIMNIHLAVSTCSVSFASSTWKLADSRAGSYHTQQPRCLIALMALSLCCRPKIDRL